MLLDIKKVVEEIKYSIEGLDDRDEEILQKMEQKTTNQSKTKNEELAN